MKRIFAVALALMGTCASAEEALRTDISVAPLSRGGVPWGCSINMKVVFADHTYRRGAISAIDGSVTIFTSDGKMGAYLKIVGFDFDAGGNATQFKVETASPRIQGIAPRQLVPIGCDHDLAFCVTYPSDFWTQQIKQLADRQSLEIAFNKAAGGLDIILRVPVQLDDTMRVINCAQGLPDAGPKN